MVIALRPGTARIIIWSGTVRRLAIATIMLALLPASAYAQDDQANQDDNGPPTARTRAELKNDAAIDKAYKDTMKRMNAYQKPVKSDDPWQTIRPAGSDSAKR